VVNQVSHHTYIHRQVTVLCPRSLHFSVANWGGEGGGNSWLQFSRHSPNFIYSLFFHVRKLGFVNIVPRCLNYVTNSKDLFAIFMLQSCLALCSREMNVLSFLSICFWINRTTGNYKNPVFCL
jgi:hypothetical protein